MKNSKIASTIFNASKWNSIKGSGEKRVEHYIGWCWPFSLKRSSSGVTAICAPKKVSKVGKVFSLDFGETVTPKFKHLYSRHDDPSVTQLYRSKPNLNQRP